MKLQIVTNLGTYRKKCLEVRVITENIMERIKVDILQRILHRNIYGADNTFYFYIMLLRRVNLFRKYILKTE